MIEKLAQYFSQFPGIGNRQSQRFVYFLLSRDPQYLKELSGIISTLRDSISQCTSCYRFHPSISTGQIKAQNTSCDVCASNETDKTLLMLVEKDTDYESIRKSATYKGRYFILGGLVPIVEKNTKQKVRIKELLETIQNQAQENKLEEIILAFSLNPQGEHTDMYIRKILSPLAQKHSFKVSTLGRGLSTGTELEYSDDDTIKNALKNRN